MSKFHRWLLNEIELWQAEGLIQPNQARQLIARYQDQASGNWGRVIFSAIGAVIFGLGIVLMFAYNWEDMSRVTKLALVLFSILLSHGFAFKFSAASSAHPKIAESLFLLGTMLFGAGIFLVAQIYHIDEHYPNGILLWAVGALALAWVIPSLVQAKLAMGLLVLWYGMELFEFHRVYHWATWLITVAIIPLAWQQRSRFLLFLSLALFLVSYTVSVADLQSHKNFIVIALLAISGSYIFLSKIVSSTRFPQSAGLFRFIGVSVCAVIFFMLTIDGFNDEFFKPEVVTISPLAWFYLLFPIISALACVVVFWMRFPKMIIETVDRIEISTVLVVLLVVTLGLFQWLPFFDNFWIFFSILYLTYSFILIWYGMHMLRWQSAALGSIMLSAFTFARFLDLFDSLLMRSLAFLILGAILFAIGIYYSKQKQKQGGQSHA